MLLLLGVACADGEADDSAEAGVEQPGADEETISRAGYVGTPIDRGAVGHFDGDSVHDVVTSEPGWDGVACGDVGRIVIDYDRVIYPASGWDNAYVEDASWHRDSTNMNETLGCSDLFGNAIVVGNFNGDGYDDLAIGVPGDDIAGVASNVGSVHIMYGSATGLQASDDLVLWQSDIGQSSEANDYWGEFLEAGDFNADGYDDLVVGAPREDVGAATDAGAISVIYGTSTGLSGTGSVTFSQGTATIEGAAESGDECGAALQAGDFDDDGYDDIAWGCPGEDISTISNAGAFGVIYGTSAGLSATGDQLWYQDVTGIDDNSEANEELGAWLAAVDVDEDGVLDLAAAPETECEVGEPTHRFYGVASTGITAADNEIECIDPSTAGINCSDNLDICGCEGPNCEVWKKVQIAIGGKCVEAGDVTICKY